MPSYQRGEVGTVHPTHFLLVVFFFWLVGCLQPNQVSASQRRDRVKGRSSGRGSGVVAAVPWTNPRTAGAPSSLERLQGAAALWTDGVPAGQVTSKREQHPLLVSRRRSPTSLRVLHRTQTRDFTQQRATVHLPLARRLRYPQRRHLE